MLDKVVVVITFTAVTFLGLAMLPYCLWRAWVKGIPFKKQGRHPDFDCSESKPVGQL